VSSPGPLLDKIGKGHFEITFRCSEQGCKLAVPERPDVILMDLEMPAHPSAGIGDHAQREICGRQGVIGELAPFRRRLSTSW
jgi:hypothetical protein